MKELSGSMCPKCGRSYQHKVECLENETAPNMKITCSQCGHWWLTDSIETPHDTASRMHIKEHIHEEIIKRDNEIIKLIIEAVSE
jgi:hypothetical protein